MGFAGEVRATLSKGLTDKPNDSDNEGGELTSELSRRRHPRCVARALSIPSLPVYRSSSSVTEYRRAKEAKYAWRTSENEHLQHDDSCQLPLLEPKLPGQETNKPGHTATAQPPKAYLLFLLSKKHH